MKTRALVLVDIQNDFLPGGSLAVPDGDQVIPIANETQGHFPLIFATQDWHPADHKSFASNWDDGKVGQVVKLNDVDQILWPDHCIQGTEGAKLAADLHKQSIYKMIYKGMYREYDSYSGFTDSGGYSTGFSSMLRYYSVDEVFILGLATDYCVKFTALDSVAAGFKTFLIEDGCRGVNLNPGDADGAVNEMREAGVTIMWSDAV